ncbi:AMP-binding protein [Pseudonocardia broussonetiae]|uniref:AMP-binding protein n=1 Tax=Pseudonocardia broussonetiae TaxID=2736640 RepID=A0A6M6JPI4_9PSEU|nr:AMP-binding protein [Pseudonocardia broussonetiae]QJY49924.1 AMP-binding protein [Pseudonocardia broussonetiae]
MTAPAVAAGPTYADLIVEALQRTPGSEAFVHGDRRMSYAEAADLTGRMVRVLADAGVGRGGAVATLSVNAPEAYLLQLAAYLLGASYSGLHPLGSPEDHVRLCDEAGITVLLVHPRFSETGAVIAQRATGVRTLLSIGPSELAPDIGALCAAQPGGRLQRDPRITHEDLAWLQYTGGTTGRPKGVMVSQRAMVQQAQTVIASFGVHAHARYLAAAPITHAASMPVLPTLLLGGTVVLHDSFDPRAFLRTLETERITYTFGVPTMMYALLEAMRTEAFDVSSLKAFAYGAAPMAPARIEEAQERFGRVLVQGYAQTECAGITTLRPDEHEPDLLTSCGRPVVGVRVAVLDEDGAEVPDGEVGEICVRSPLVMSGYLEQPEETARALRGDWLHTDDLGRRDDRGFLHIVDRAKDMIISGGFNVYPREVEDILTAHPAVASAAVIGAPDDRWGEAVHAFVVARGGEDAPPRLREELTAAVRARKGAHYAPKSVEIVSALPTTAVGKIDKKLLRAGLWAGRDRAIG